MLTKINKNVAILVALVIVGIAVGTYVYNHDGLMNKEIQIMSKDDAIKHFVSQMKLPSEKEVAQMTVMVKQMPNENMCKARILTEQMCADIQDRDYAIHKAIQEMNRESKDKDEMESTILTMSDVNLCTAKILNDRVCEKIKMNPNYFVDFKKS